MRHDIYSILQYLRFVKSARIEKLWSARVCLEKVPGKKQMRQKTNVSRNILSLLRILFSLSVIHNSSFHIKPPPSRLKVSPSRIFLSSTIIISSLISFNSALLGIKPRLLRQKRKYAENILSSSRTVLSLLRLNLSGISYILSLIV